MSRRRREEKDESLTREVIAESCYRALQAALNDRSTDWDKAGQAIQEGFLRVAGTAEEMVNSGFTAPTGVIASKLYHAFAQQEGYVGLEPPWQVAWQAVARHAAYLAADADVGEQLTELEQSWREWAREKLAKV